MSTTPPISQSNDPVVFVTGGTGFLGAYIIKELIGNGHRVRALRRSARLPFFIPDNIMSGVEWVEGDILDVDLLHDAMDHVDGVIHAAALVSFSSKERRKMYHVNVEGTANVVNAALDQGVRRFLHVSSVAALGRTLTAQLVTEEKKWEPNGNNTHYAISKHHAELHVWRGFAEGLDGVIINPSTILGFGDWHQSSCAIFRNTYREFPWFTKGVNGFVGVEDVSRAAVQLLFSSITEKKFIINAENWSFQRLFNAIADGFGKKRPHKEASRTMAGLAWRMEAIGSVITGKKPVLTRETAKLAQSKTSFDNHAILSTLPGFNFTPLELVIKNSCAGYSRALENGQLRL